jgi:hypothetical protein
MVLPVIEAKYDVKIVAVTSPQLYEELRRRDPEKANAILSDGERQYVTTSRSIGFHGRKSRMRSIGMQSSTPKG